MNFFRIRPYFSVKEIVADILLIIQFGIEYPGIIFDLFRDESISKTTFRYVLDTNLDFIAGMYFEYHIRKHYCSYDLNGLKDIFGVFYSKSKFWMKVIQITVKRLAKKIVKF